MAHRLNRIFAALAPASAAEPQAVAPAPAAVPPPKSAAPAASVRYVVHRAKNPVRAKPAKRSKRR